MGLYIKGQKPSGPTNDKCWWMHGLMLTELVITNTTWPRNLWPERASEQWTHSWSPSQRLVKGRVSSSGSSTCTVVEFLYDAALPIWKTHGFRSKEIEAEMAWKFRQNHLQPVFYIILNIMMHDYKILTLTYIQPWKIICTYSFLDSYLRRHFTKKGEDTNSLH